ncbi:MAG: 4Fe-4S dicluster domain-containing protein [Spirochaetaceae bacterium]|nr:4Fe-4S dicluster domain-containing protein [Spirochaetaceae bacterium]
MARGIVKFNDPMCKGCGLCIGYCPKGILKLDTTRMNDKGYNLVTNEKPEECIGCAICAQMCPDSVITVYKEET